MNREDLVTWCELVASRRAVVHIRARLDDGRPVEDPVPEILRSFRRAEISESEKNALVGLVTDDEHPGEDILIRELADDQAASGDDD